MKLDKEKLINNQVIYTFENGDKLIYKNRGIFIPFQGTRRVISTSALNGGVREDLEGVFNFNCLGEQYECTMTKDTYEKELIYNAKELGMLDINNKGDKLTGLSTAAWIEYASICEEEFQGVKVTAIVTAGIDKNAVRVGDPASYYEEHGEFYMLNHRQKVTAGTINTFVYINKNLTPGALTRALVTCSEAKTVAVEELLIGSLYSSDLATGSGTDGIIIISDSSSQDTLTDASEHGKLGEMLGRVVINATKEALSLQTGVGGPRQHKISERGKHYGITIGSLWNCYEIQKEEISKLYERNLIKKQFKNISEFEERFGYFDTNSNCVVWLSLYFHLLDQYKIGMLQWGEVVRESKQLTKSLLQIENDKIVEWIFKLPYKENLINELVDQARRSILTLLLR